MSVGSKPFMIYTTTEPTEITEKNVFLCDFCGLCGSKFSQINSP